MTGNFDEASVSDLTGDVKREAAADALAHSIRVEDLRKKTQANDLRNLFFWLAAGLAAVTVLTSAGLVISVLAGAEIDGTVAIAFISGLAVETVGVLAIMAGYLFPRASADE